MINVPSKGKNRKNLKRKVCPKMPFKAVMVLPKNFDENTFVLYATYNTQL